MKYSQHHCITSKKMRLESFATYRKVELPEFEPIGSKKTVFYRNKMEFSLPNSWLNEAE
jgi:hypothetical protein